MRETIKRTGEAVRTENLTKIYQGRTVLKDLNLSVKTGTVFGLLGANGVGKSTTIECILGTKQMDRGTALVLGHDAKKDRRVLFEKVGVQRNTSRGAGISARTINSRCRSPPERLFTLFFILSPIPKRSQSFLQSAGLLYRQAVSSQSSDTLISGW